MFYHQERFSSLPPTFQKLIQVKFFNDNEWRNLMIIVTFIINEEIETLGP